MLETRGIVRHTVFITGDEEGFLAVSVRALVEAGEIAEVCAGTFGGDRASGNAG